MKIKFFSMLIALVVVSNVYSQSNLNDYKYVIVPNKFDFLKAKDQYQLNSLTVFLFEKHGFLALKEGDTYPSDLANNRCLALRSDLVKGSGMFKTKLTIEVKDCNDQVVFTSQVGESREKEYKKAYTEAVRNAFKSFETINYSYVPNKNNAVSTSESVSKVETNSQVAEEIQKLKKEIQTLKKEKESEVVETVPVRVIPAKEIPNVKEIKDVKTVAVKHSSTGVLYAQEIDNGFQLVDSSPKVIYRIKRTGLDNVFLVEGKSTVLYKKGERWILEYYAGNTLKQEVLNIKF